MQKKFQKLKKDFFMKDISCRRYYFFFKFNIFFAHENMKKTASKVVHNRPQFFCIANRPKINPDLIFCSIKMAPSVTSRHIMTLFAIKVFPRSRPEGRKIRPDRTFSNQVGTWLLLFSYYIRTVHFHYCILHYSSYYINCPKKCGQHC